MTHYLDLGFLLCLVTKAPGSAVAWRILRTLSPPLPITALQAMQVENGIRKSIHAPDPRLQAAAAQAWGLWESYTDEQVFDLAAAPWEAAFSLARSWNRSLSKEPPSNSFILHVAIAAAAGCTHFLSFQPESRALASAAGLKLLPERL